MGSQPAVMSPTQEPAPHQYTPSAQQTVTNADFQRRQEELERKAAELARREEELKNSPYNARVNNWPPLPSFMPCQPCFYQDINVDIPVEFQEMVKRLYYLWLFHSLLMIANLLGGICFLFSGMDKGSMFGLGLVYGAFFIPLSFLCWFRPAYKAFRNDSSFNFMLTKIHGYYRATGASLSKAQAAAAGVRQGFQGGAQGQPQQQSAPRY